MTAKPSDTDILHRTRVLALDDEPLVLETYGKLFAGRVETASTVAAGMGKLRHDEDLRIVLLDWKMPDGGLGFLKLMKRKFPERLTIVLADTASPIDQHDKDALGVFRCLEKSGATFAMIEDAIRDGIGLLRLRARTG